MGRRNVPRRRCLIEEEVQATLASTVTRAELQKSNLMERYDDLTSSVESVKANGRLGVGREGLRRRQLMQLCRASHRVSSGYRTILLIPILGASDFPRSKFGTRCHATPCVVSPPRIAPGWHSLTPSPRGSPSSAVSKHNFSRKSFTY